MNLISQMKNAGLGRALKDSLHKTHIPCTQKHANYLTRHKFSFCPHCGKKLEIYKRCDKCKKNFFSEKSYTVHLGTHGSYPPQCKCRAVGERLEKVGDVRYRCKECSKVFDWVYKSSKAKRKSAYVVYGGITNDR